MSVSVCLHITCACLHLTTFHYSYTEESYIWVLGPEERKGHVGLHYLVVKPIVGAGVTSINATVSVSSIAAQCKFWNDSTSAWSENGCRVRTNYTIASYFYLTSIKRTY